MAAGLGFKDFTTGEVLTAADVDGYLMQGIWVFASNAARDAAVTAPAEGNFAFTKDTNSLWYYDGAAWVASGATGDIEGVTAGVGISGGGTSGTVTVTNSMATEIAAKGDLIVGTGSQTFDNLTVGTNGHTLVADSSTATGLAWSAPAGASFKGVSLYDTGNTQTISNATDTAVTFNSEIFDTDGFHSTSTNTSRVTIPAGMGGYYLLTCGQLWDSNATGRRQTFVLKNGANDIMAKAGTIAGSSAGAIGSWGSAVANLSAGDYIELMVQQTSGGSLNCYKRQEDVIFTVTYLGA